jgi:hypothetical protein
MQPNMYLYCICYFSPYMSRAHILTQHSFNDIVYCKHKHNAECIANNDLTYQVLPLIILFIINIGAKWWHKQAAQDTPDDGPGRTRNM